MEPSQFPPELNPIISEVPGLIRTDSGFDQPVSTVNNEATQSDVLHDTTAPLDAVTPHFAVDVKSSIEPSPASQPAENTPHNHLRSRRQSLHGIPPITRFSLLPHIREADSLLACYQRCVSTLNLSPNQLKTRERDAKVTHRQSSRPLPRAVASKTPESEKQRQLRLLSTYSHILTDTGSSTSSSSWEYYYSEESSEEFRRHEIIEKLNREKAVLHTKTLELDLQDTPAKPSRRGSSANSLWFFHHLFHSSSSDPPPKGSVEATLPPSQQHRPSSRCWPNRRPLFSEIWSVENNYGRSI
ncbi:hypothetical protein BLNAU_19979 [Blattamonas nauphoetae]|uniref:Uncharacterized protein n=1 Tax=Blattamonas nauphoetae TaxID=2049346 RepID=A0ABQ9WZX7_9EUKA|nr:hypothetical protein BLNAU_19979 [Blattamonas nauphoetae]